MVFWKPTCAHITAFDYDRAGQYGTFNAGYDTDGGQGPHPADGAIDTGRLNRSGLGPPWPRLGSRFVSEAPEGIVHLSTLRPGPASGP